MPIRRSADPFIVRHVWDAIRSAILQRQMAETKRIVKYLTKSTKLTQSAAEVHIQQCLSDGLIVALHKVTRTSNGDTVESFRIPSQELPILDGKDWYCFECHLAGDVVACGNCFRVFHSACTSTGRRRFDEYKKTNQSDYIPNNSLLVTATAITTDANNENVTANNISSNSDELEKIESTKLLLNNNDSNSSGQSKEQQCDENYDDLLCSMCNIAKVDKTYFEKGELNYLLKFVLHRIQSWLPNTITHTMAAEDRPEWLTDKELTWRANQLFFQHKDMSVIEVNLNNESYSYIHEFLADVLTIQHNVAIFHGFLSQEYGASDLMIRDCMHDLTELKLCIDCYRHSNEKINAKWFCLPCRQPHKLVWAKQKGYPYWPAKILRETSTHFDVRFFGGKYERSLLQKNSIKPIETPQSQLQIKSSSAFNRSVEELKFHQKLLQNPDDLQKFVEASKQKRLNSKKTSTPLKPSKNTSSISLLNESTHNTSSHSGDPYDFEDDSFGTTQNLTFSPNRRSKKRSSSSSLNQSGSTKKKKSIGGNETGGGKGKGDGIIHISDGEEEQFSYRNEYGSAAGTPNVGISGIPPPPPPVQPPIHGEFNFNGNYEQVSSSTGGENFNNGVGRSQENGMQQLDHPYSDSVEKMRRRLESLEEKNDLIKCAMDCMQAEIDKVSNDNNEHLKRLFESHNAQISETKKKQWCYNCEQEAIYHCCWNTAYCSQTCQQQHWQAEHKKVCRRKR